MNPEEIRKILIAHEKWLEDEENGERADLSGANLSGANLSDADLSGANLDFASLPLWCGSLKMRIDERIEKQVLYHLISIATDKTRYADLIDFANESHLVSERNLPKLEAKDAEIDTETISAKEAEAAE